VIEKLLSPEIVNLIEVTGAVLGLGLLDSLNPFSIAAMALVLTGSRPLALGGVFIATTFVIYTLAGAGMLAGWATVLAQFLPLIPAWVLDVGLVILGVSCLIGAWYMWVNAANSSSPMVDLIRTSVLGTALYAASSTVSDLPTAVPYFAVVHVLAEAKTPLVMSGALLVLYNFCYVAPLALLLLVRLNGKAGVDKVFSKIKSVVDWSFSRLVPPLTGLLGLYCLWEVVRHWL
jgi:cytochrome c biogenesis protein CcdA